MRMFQALFAAAVLSGPIGAQALLYPGEERLSVAGFPTVAWFHKGDPEKPLLVFVPGAHNTARISYGGHPGSRRSDFLAHWLGAKGYSFLALSYPIETRSRLFATVHPAFTAQEWGRQVVEAARWKIREHGLGNHLVLLAWSMAGKSVQPVFHAAAGSGLVVDAAISMAATTGIPGVNAYVSRLAMAPSGYARREPIYAGWLAMMALNDHGNGGRTAIPPDVYLADYVGNMPVGLEGLGEVYRNGRFELDPMAQATDYGAFSFAEYPLVAVLQGDSPLDARHALADQASWQLYNTYTVLQRLLAERRIDPAALQPERWRRLLALTQGLGQRLSIPVGGNHFFFVGEAGARRTADAIETALGAVQQVQRELSEVLGGAVE